MKCHVNLKYFKNNLCVLVYPFINMLYVTEKMNILEKIFKYIENNAK